MATPARPLLVGPAGARTVFRKPGGGGGGGARNPKKARQVERLGPAFAALADAFAQQRGALQSDASAAVPEQVLVIETNGTVKDLYETVARTSGFEWLAEEDLRDHPPDEDFFISKKPGKALTAQLYLVLFNQEAIAQLLSLWRSWSAAPKRARLPKEFRAWGAVFRQLRSIRRWGVQDRLQERGILDSWRERIREGYETVAVEIDLWFRSAERRAEVDRKVRAHVERAGGQVTSNCVLEPIAYHAILAKLPIRAVEKILANHEVELLQCDEVRLFRPAGQGTPVPDDEPELEVLESTAIEDLRDPVVALLDGLPLERHRRLAGRLVVDDPDDWSETYPVQTRSHGTAMASLILHGDLSGASSPGRRRLYVRPILRPDSFGRREVAPEDLLLVDLVHRAVRRIAEGERNQPAAAPTVRVINLSIGDPYQPFVLGMSPLAKLLDWLAWRYRVLFIVSAGNHNGALAVDRSSTSTAVLAAVAAEHRHHRILSPGEAVNALTVGASSEDEAGAWTPRAEGESDFAIPVGLPSPISGWGRGYRRIVKPDVLAPGGRVAFAPTPEGLRTMSPAIRSRFPPGHKVAAPSLSAGDLAGTRFWSGTSNAAAMTSRLAGAIADALEDLAPGPNSDVLRAVPAALWIRTLVVHGASWRPGTQRALEVALHEAGHDDPSTDELAGVLGFGRIDEDRVLECAPERATVLVGGAIGADERIVHSIPLPPSLNAHTAWRRLTVTLSWFSPVRPTHRKYRCAALWFEPPANPLTVKRIGVDWQAVRRGTLQHEILEGDQTAINVLPHATLDVPVSCMEDAGQMTEAIPYALAVTIEVRPGIPIRVYDEVRARILPRVVVRP
jgi:hypothetical protein